jgi:hypothetical protein
MTIFDDPNREAVGLAPIWTGAGESEPPVVPEQKSSSSGAFDPGEHTVAEVEDYVAKHPDQADAVLAAEQAGKNRTTLVSSLEGGE